MNTMRGIDPSTKIINTMRDINPAMALLDREVPFVSEAVEVLKEKGLPIELFSVIKSASEGLPAGLSREEWKAEEQRLIREEFVRQRARLDEAAAVVRERKASASTCSGVVRIAADDAYGEVLDGLEPDPQPAALPGLTSIKIRVSGEALEHVPGAFILAAHQNLVLLTVGSNRKGGFLSNGFYLVYDAWGNSLTAIPLPPHNWSESSIGGSEVAVLRHRLPSDYVLAELVFSDVRPDAGNLSLLWSSGSSAGEWSQKQVILPSNLRSSTYTFFADSVFSLGSGYICWVDLFIGILTCNVFSLEPMLRFIPLPKQCTMSPHPDYGRRLPEEHRSMCCSVDEKTIKFVYMDGYFEGRPMENVTLNIWTMNTNIDDVSVWTKVAVLCVGDLWIAPSYTCLSMPPLEPTFPIPSMLEDDVIYVYMIDSEFVCKRQEIRGQYILSLDMRNGKVVSALQLPSQCPFAPRPFASNFNMFLGKRKAWRKAQRIRMATMLADGATKADMAGMHAKRVARRKELDLSTLGGLVGSHPVGLTSLTLDRD